MGLLQATREASDNARLAAHTDCLTALHLLRRYWHAPHTMAHHHELTLVKALADAVVQRKYGVDFIKVKAHSKLHGNEVADRIANLAAKAQVDVETEGVHHLTDTESTYPQGIGLVCPWSAVSPHVRANADPSQADNGPFHIYNAHATVSHLVDASFERTLLTDKAHIHAKLPKGLAGALGDDPLNPENPHRPMRHIGHQFWNKIPGWALRTTVGVRSNRYFAGAAAYFAGATDDIYCTICPDKTMEGGWAHTLSCCLNPVIKGMRINRHNELVRVLRDAILHSKKGNAKVYADLVATRDDTIIPQATDEEWDFEAHDSGSEQTLHDTAPAQIDPLAPAEDPQITRAVLIDGAPGPLRVGAESLPSIPYVRTSDNTDEEDCAASVRPSRTVHAYLLGNRRVKKADDGFFHVTPDLVVVEKTKSPNHYTVTLVDVTFCLEHRVAQAIATKRSHYKPLCEALRRQGHAVPEVAVIVICVRGSIPASTLETLKLLGLNQEPAETLLRKTHISACEHMRRMCHTRRAIESVTMGPQGIVTRLHRRNPR